MLKSLKNFDFYDRRVPFGARFSFLGRIESARELYENTKESDRHAHAHLQSTQRIEHRTNSHTLRLGQRL